MGRWLVSDVLVEEGPAEGPAPVGSWSQAKPGDVIARKYRVDALLGSGGVGVVLAATHLQLGTSVAIKFLHPDSLENPVAAERFLREARAMARIESEHVVRVLDVDTLPSGEPFIVMEKLDGTDLADLLDQCGRLVSVDAVDLAMEICRALQAAHALGIIHRDLKPSNVFLARDRRGREIVKLLDFGVAKVIGRRSFDGRLTTDNAILGSPLYMSPEQMRDSTLVDGRTDIWAIGALLFEMLTGRPPFVAPTFPLICTLVLHGKPVAMRETGVEIPTELEAVIERCLKKQPAQRYGSVEELAAALEPFSSCRPAPAVTTAAPRSSSRGARWKIIVAACAAAIFAGVLAAETVGWFRSRANQVGVPVRPAPARVAPPASPAVAAPAPAAKRALERGPVRAPFARPAVRRAKAPAFVEPEIQAQPTSEDPDEIINLDHALSSPLKDRKPRAP